ncbi:MAG: hypothetical protein ACI86H_001066 [bacterium]|jgi:hypothetical protein
MLFLRIFLIAVSLATANWVYQVINKPAEIISIFGTNLYKSTVKTWDHYQDSFQKHATKIITAEFLAALAQVESGGNPLATSQWRWRWTSNITRIYAPSSSSVGLYQYTTSTFQDAQRFCARSGKITVSSNWYNRKGCKFNYFYTRLSSSNSIEVTAARLHYYTNRIIYRKKIKLTQSKKQQLAAIIHLCGISAGRRFAKNNFQLSKLPRCGSHSTRRYIRKIVKLQKQFNTYTF